MDSSRHLDTFCGRVCECPVVKGVKFVGDGYTHCEASGSGRCEINNGGCWKETRHGRTYSAYTLSDEGCKCPAGFKGDGIHKCEGVSPCLDFIIRVMVSTNVKVLIFSVSTLCSIHIRSRLQRIRYVFLWMAKSK